MSKPKGCACQASGGCTCGKNLPRAHVIEIYESGRSSGPDAAGTVFIPDMARIDGHLLLMPPGGIKVHEIPLGDEPVKVTITLYARRVTIGAELDDASGEPAAIPAAG